MSWLGVVWCGVNGAKVAEQIVSRVFFLASYDEHIATGKSGAFPLKHVINLFGQILISRKLAITDDPNIRLRCNTNVKKLLFYW